MLALSPGFVIQVTTGHGQVLQSHKMLFVIPVISVDTGAMFITLVSKQGRLGNESLLFSL